MFLVYATVVVIVTGSIILYEFLMEDTSETMKEVMEEERNIPRGIYGLKRENVIAGVFRQHNQSFRDNGFKPPKGTA